MNGQARHATPRHAGNPMAGHVTRRRPERAVRCVPRVTPRSISGNLPGDIPGFLPGPALSLRQQQPLDAPFHHRRAQPRQHDGGEGQLKPTAETNSGHNMDGDIVGAPMN